MQPLSGTLTIKANNYGSEAGHYGVIVEDPAYEKINGTNYVALKTWTEGATENTTFLVKGTNTSAYRKGNAFKYDTDDTETVGGRNLHRYQECYSDPDSG